MPNIQQLIALKEKYGSKNKINTRQLRVLNESFSASSDQKTRLFSISGLDPKILQFFERQQSADVVLLFIDITGFSKKCKNLTNNELSVYLDNYYDKVIPIIYAHGGEIEKIIGDGIIAFFGQPFLDNTKDGLLEKADKCAKDVIINLKGTDKEIKIALHDGNIMYYKNKALNYPEYTMIGKPLTELFRLESVALNNSISFYTTCPYDNKPYSQSGAYCLTYYKIITCKYFNKSPIKPVTLEGVDLSNIKHLICTT